MAMFWGIGSGTGLVNGPPREGEAATLLTALRCVSEDGHEDVIFEVDTEAIQHALASNEDDLSEFGCIVKQCQDIINAFPRFRVQVVGEIGTRLHIC
ncbi:hypothetical protein LINPERPRIM_LOCUS11646 [Linum perenne]